MCIVKFSLFQSSLLLLVNDSLGEFVCSYTRVIKKTDQKCKALNFWANDIVYRMTICHFICTFYLFLAVLSFCCCRQAFPSCDELGLLSVVARGLGAHGLRWLWLESTGSVLVARRLSPSAACGSSRPGSPALQCGLQSLDHGEARVKSFKR